MRVTKLFAALVAVLVLLSACSTVKLDPKAPVEDRTGKNASANKSSNGADTGAAGNRSADSRSENNNGNSAKQADKASASSSDPINDVTGILSNRSVYFDFDSYTIKEEFKSIVEAHGQYLTTHTDRKVVIQGNTDERGGSEYNLALGQKRAEAVRRALSVLGVSDSQMEAVSFGKEKPRATGSDEASWAENRRADLVY